MVARRPPGWTAIRPRWASVRRAAVGSVDGTLWAPERSAIDDVRLDGAGRMMTGPPTDMTSYPYFGADVMAVADGPVVGLVSDLPEHSPGTPPA
jgi:hypothetical protein